MLVLAPVMCILSGIGVSQVLSTYMKNLDISRPDKKSKKQQDSTYPIKNEVRGWSDCSVLKGTDCSSRGPEFDSWQPPVAHNHL
jgi:hypothetical protein